MKIAPRRVPLVALAAALATISLGGNGASASGPCGGSIVASDLVDPPVSGYDLAVLEAAEIAPVFTGDGPVEFKVFALLEGGGAAQGKYVVALGERMVRVQVVRHYDWIDAAGDEATIRHEACLDAPVGRNVSQFLPRSVPRGRSSACGSRSPARWTTACTWSTPTPSPR